MKIKTITPKSIEELSHHIKQHTPSIYTSSKTSTVIPYGYLEEYLSNFSKLSEVALVDLSLLPSSMEITQDGDVKIRGPLNWKQLKDYLNTKGRSIKTAPTEDLALVCAGVATSCTGERCFSFGNLRSQVKNPVFELPRRGSLSPS